jgi:hypothetical protein
MGDVVRNLLTGGVNIASYTGAEKQNFRHFKRQILAGIAYAQVADEPQRIAFLNLNLGGAAADFIDGLDAGRRNTLELCLNELEAQFARRRPEVQVLKLNERKLLPGESIQSYYQEMSRIAELAYDVAAIRECRLREAFIAGLPNKLKRKLYDAPPATDSAALCEIAVNKTILDKLCDVEADHATFNQFDEEDEPRTSYKRPSGQMTHSTSSPIDHMTYRLDAIEEQLDMLRRECGPPLSPVTCENCGNRGHVHRDCWSPEQQDSYESMPPDQHQY